MPFIETIGVYDLYIAYCSCLLLWMDLLMALLIVVCVYFHFDMAGDSEVWTQNFCTEGIEAMYRRLWLFWLIRNAGKVSVYPVLVKMLLVKGTICNWQAVCLFIYSFTSVYLFIYLFIYLSGCFDRVWMEGKYWYIQH